MPPWNVHTATCKILLQPQHWVLPDSTSLCKAFLYCSCIAGIVVNVLLPRQDKRTAKSANRPWWRCLYLVSMLSTKNLCDAKETVQSDFIMAWCKTNSKAVFSFPVTDTSFEFLGSYLQNTWSIFTYYEWVLEYKLQKQSCLVQAILCRA